jgi:hypothetical protein
MRFALIVVGRALLCVSSTSIALADELPTLNVAPLCQGIADQGADPLQAGDQSVSFSQCMQSEQRDRTTVAKEWSGFSPESQQMCSDEAVAGGDSSYTDLLTCLEMARDVNKESAAGGASD